MVFKKHHTRKHNNKRTKRSSKRTTNRNKKYKTTRKHLKRREQKGGYIQLVDPEYESNPERTFNKITYAVEMPGVNLAQSMPNYEFFFRISQSPNYIHQVDQTQPPHSCMFEAFFVDKSNPNVELGHFSLHGLSYISQKPSQASGQLCDIFSSGYPVSMGIGIEPNIRGGGLSRILVYIVTQAILQMYPSVAQAPSVVNLYIDVDASAGFWDKLGMKPEKGFERELQGTFRPPGYGYEKVIDFQKLTNFGLGLFK